MKRYLQDKVILFPHSSSSFFFKLWWWRIIMNGNSQYSFKNDPLCSKNRLLNLSWKLTMPNCQYQLKRKLRNQRKEV